MKLLEELRKQSKVMLDLRRKMHDSLAAKLAKVPANGVVVFRKRMYVRDPGIIRPPSTSDPADIHIRCSSCGRHAWNILVHNGIP